MLALHPLMNALVPELILAAGAILLLLLGLARGVSRYSMGLALLVILTALLVTSTSTSGAVLEMQADAVATVETSISSLNTGPLVRYVRLVTLALGALILLVNRHVPCPEERSEFFALILFSLCGVMMVSLANNLILLFLALELVSVPTYILIGLSRVDIRAQEATGKYFFLGAFAAALTLYGFSFLYGATGTMTMFGGSSSLVAALSAEGALRDPLVLVGLILAIGGLSFKIAAVPFHFYAADVYQGAASPITGMLGFVPKFAGFIAIIQLLSLCSWQYTPALFWLLWALAVATMFVGNTLALMQHNVKRMLAYSSIAHTGYMLVALVAGQALFSSADAAPLRNGPAILLFYMTVYGVMNLGAFAALSFFRKIADDGESDSVERLDELAGVARNHPWAGLALAICVLGLMGFPLTGGFVGKLYLFSAALFASETPVGSVVGLSSAMHTGLIVLVVLGVVNSAIAAAYYLRILASCYLRKPAAGILPTQCPALRWSMALCALFVVAIFLRPGILFNESQKAASAIAAQSAIIPAPFPSKGLAMNQDHRPAHDRTDP